MTVDFSPRVKKIIRKNFVLCTDRLFAALLIGTPKKQRTHIPRPHNKNTQQKPKQPKPTPKKEEQKQHKIQQQ